MTPRALVIQHFPADAPWYVEEALTNADVRMDLRSLNDGHELPPSLDEHDALVILGGPDSASQQGNGYPSLASELRLFIEAHTTSKPALGICLGAQVLARAAGANVYPGLRGKEIGWGKIVLTDEASNSGYLPDGDREIVALHWHGDTFDLPSGATLLASSDRYAQAFEWGSCLGLQCHVEVDSLEAVRAFLDAFPEEAELANGGASGILQSAEQALLQLQPLRSRVLDWWARSIVPSPVGPISVSRQDA